MNIRGMVQRTQELFLLFILTLFSKATGVKPLCSKPSLQDGGGFCLSWRLAVEANNVRAWRTVPTQCLRYIETYMTGGQYDQDVDFTVGEILSYVNGIALSGDGMDALILDVDDTCISNVFYYKSKRYG